MTTEGNPSPDAPRPALMSMKELADHFQVPLQTVRRWRTDKYGPPGFTVGRYVRYRVADVEAWEQEQIDKES